MDERVRSDPADGLPESPGDRHEGRFLGILFDPDDCPTSSHPDEPACFRDLNLDQVVHAATMGRDEYDLVPFFYKPLRQPDALEYRHEVFRDLENQAIAEALTGFAAAMREVQSTVARATKFSYPLQGQAELVAAAETYGAAVVELLSRLDTAAPTSRGLLALTEWLGTYVSGPDFQALLGDARDVRAALDTIRYSLLINGNSVRVTRYSDAEDYSAIISDVFSRFAQVKGQNRKWEFQEHLEMNHVEAGILDRVVKLFPEPFEKLAAFAERWSDFVDPVLARFDREIQFYLAWLGHVAPMREFGLSLSLPELSGTSKEESAEGAFDIALAQALVSESRTVVTNDFRLSGAERIFVVTGPNQGGKTTFARMIGQMHWLAALGLPVPGEAVRLFLPDQFFSHFEREETVTTEHSKLEEEVFRIHKILKSAGPESLIVINEIFTSTSVEDAVSLATDVMHQIIDLDCLAVCVTFLDEVSQLGPSVVSCMSTVVHDNPSERTYRIERRPADGNAYAISLAKRRGLTKPQILGRIPS